MWNRGFYLDKCNFLIRTFDIFSLYLEGNVFLINNFYKFFLRGFGRSLNFLRRVSAISNASDAPGASRGRLKDGLGGLFISVVLISRLVVVVIVNFNNI